MTLNCSLFFVILSAGVGRTGTLLAARFLLEKLRSNPETIDIFGTILSLRKWRPTLVQTPVRNFPFAQRLFIVKKPNYHFFLLRLNLSSSTNSSSSALRRRDFSRRTKTTLPKVVMFFRANKLPNVRSGYVKPGLIEQKCLCIVK